METAVTPTDEDHAVGDGRRAGDPDLIVDGRVVTGHIPPPFAPGGRIDRVEVAIPAADVDQAIGDGGRRVDDVTGGKSPSERTGGCIERVDILVPAPDVECAA